MTAGTFISDDVQNMGFNSSWLVSGGQSYALYSTDTQNRYTVGVYDPERAEDVVFVGGIVAAIGDETYSDIAAAVEAAGDNDTIKLLTSVNGLTVIAGKNITLDLNGFNVTAAAAGEYAVTVESGALLIIVGDGDVSGYNGESGYSYQNNGTLELRGGTYTQILDFAVVGDDCSVAITDNGAFTVSEEAAVATITRDAITYNFANVQSAFRFAQNNDTIVLQQDASAGGIQFNVGEDETIVFDLNGHDVSANSVFFNMLSGTLSIVNGDTQGSTMTTKQRAFQIMPNIGCTATLQLGENITVRAGGDNAVFMQTNYDSDYVKTNGTENLPLESVLISSADIIATNGVAIQGNGTMHGTRIVINGCSVVSETSHAIYHPQYGELIIENADVKGWVTGVEIRAGVLEVRNSTIIGSGSFSAEANGDGTTVSGAAVAVSQHTTDLPVSVTIEEGSVLRGEKALYEEDLQNSTVTDIELSVTGGSFEGEVYSQNVSAFIAGGSFDTDLTDTYLTEGYVQDESGEIITEEEANAVAMIETETGFAYYDTLQAAIDEASDGDTVTLLADTKLEGDRIEIGSASEESAAAFEITFDLNGYTLKIGLVAADISAEEPNYNTAALFVGYNATLNLIDSSKEGTGTIDAQEASDLTVPVAAMRAGAVLNISGGTIIVDTAYESCVYAGGGGVVVINGGTFINRCAEPFIHVSDGSSPALAVNISDSYTDGGTYLTINGGTFVGRNPMLGDTNPAVTSSYMGSDVNIAQFSDGSFAAVGADEPLPEGAAYLYTVENGEVVVTVYTEEALSAAVAGDETFADNTYATVRLGTDITQSIVIEGGRDLTLDLNGKTLTNTAGDHTITNYGTLTIIDSGENGTVTNTTTSRAAVENEGTAYLNGGTYTRTADGTWYVIVNNGVMELRDITVTNLNVNDPSSLVQNNLDMDSANPAQLTIYSGTYACAGGNTIMNNDYGVLTIEDGTFGASNFTDVYNYQAVQNYGTLVINGGTFTANSVAVSASSYGVLETSTTINGGTFCAGSDGSAAALYIYDDDGTGFINVTINGGEFSGVYAIRSFRTDTTGESLSVAGGTFEGEIAVGGLVGFITGGSFKQQPAEELFDENYAAEYQNGYYVAVRSDALKTARANAKADVRGYAAANGISWLALEDEAAPAEGEEPVYTAQQAADILAAFNAIDSAMTQLAVAEARLAAMNMVDAYVEALDTYKLDMIGDLQTAAADDEETADVDESVVLPTATYSAIYNATSASEIDFYVANALAEIEAIRSLRTEISGQTQQLADLADALEAMSDGLFGDTESGTQGAFAELFDKVQTAISDAQNAIVNGNEEGSTSLASIQEYLEDTINKALERIEGALTNTETGLAAIKEALDTLDVSSQLADEFEDVLAAIIKAQDAITGSTDGEGGTSIGEAITQINGATQDYINGLREALIGENGTLTQVAAAVQGLTELDIGGKFDGVLTAITNAQNAIMGVTEEDADGVNLSEVLGAVNTADSVIDQVLAAVQGLADEDDGIVAQIKTELKVAQGDLDSLTGALLEANGGLATDITDALAAIDQIAAAIGSLGTGEGNDLATQIGNIVSDLEDVQGAVNTIGDNLGVAVDIEETKTNAVAELENWLSAYLDTLLGTTTDEAESGVVMLAVTLETEDGDLYGRLTQAYSEANAQLILKYYNQALTAIDNATSTTDVSTAVSTFRAQVASVDAAAQNTPSMTGVYVLLAIVLVVLIAASIVVILKNRKAAAAAVAAQPAAEAAAEEKPAEEAKPEAAEEAAEAESEEADKAEEELAADDDDKEQVVIAANVRSFAEAYVELSDEQRELFNKVKEYALGKEGTSEVKLSSGDCVKLGSKQVVKLAVRRGNPVALFVLENEMLKDFRRGATTQAKLKVRATELVLREEADLETAYTMVDLSVDQIKKDAAAAKERRREQRRERRKQRLAEEAARQAEHDGSED